VIQCASFTEQAGAEAVDAAIRRGKAFTAIVAANDLLAIGAQQALIERGLGCPHDISITGYNDVDYVSKLTPPLTTVRVPLNRMGGLAARTLLDWIGGDEPELGAQTLLPVEFMQRGTTGPARPAP
jgi:LacI family transcriptional regulator